MDPVTLRLRRQAAAEGAAGHQPQFASEAERELSAEELAHLIQRLNAKGVIKCSLPGLDDSREAA